MINFKKIVSGFLAVSITLTGCFSFESFAEPAVETNFVYSEWDRTNEYAYSQITNKKTVISDDFVLSAGAELRINPGSTLVISKNATFTVRGKLIIERGAKLYIAKGKCVLDNAAAEIKSFGGTIHISKASSLEIKRGSLRKYAGSDIVWNGKFKFLKNSNFKNVINRIKNDNNKFDLNDYEMYFDVGTRNLSPNFASLYMYYTIDNIVTDFRYTYGKSSSRKGIIKTSDIPLKTVYDKALTADLRERVSKFESNSGHTPSLYSKQENIYMNYKYIYNYNSPDLFLEVSYFTYNSADDMFMEKLIEESIA